MFQGVGLKLSLWALSAVEGSGFSASSKGLQGLEFLSDLVNRSLTKGKAGLQGLGFRVSGLWGAVLNGPLRYTAC